jgi:cellulose biosynthesis protein BcsQ
MAKTINLFNHKGGVSKTTTAFNLGWMLASLGKRVVMADFDPQCNLTEMVLGFQGVDDLETAYRSDPPNNIKEALAPAFESKPKQIVGADCVNVPGNPNLFLLPGHIGLAEYEHCVHGGIDHTIAVNASSSSRMLQLSGTLISIARLASVAFARNRTSGSFSSKT